MLIFGGGNGTSLEDEGLTNEHVTPRARTRLKVQVSFEFIFSMRGFPQLRIAIRTRGLLVQVRTTGVRRQVRYHSRTPVHHKVVLVYIFRRIRERKKVALACPHIRDDN